MGNRFFGNGTMLYLIRSRLCASLSLSLGYANDVDNGYGNDGGFGNVPKSSWPNYFPFF